MALPHKLVELLGVSLADLTEKDLQALVEQSVREADVLEFKKEHYVPDRRLSHGANDKGKAELAKDVAAMANANGGAIVIGIEEVDSVAVGLNPIALSDGAIRQIRQILAARVFPPADFELHPVPGEIDREEGSLLITIPRSYRSPHAVSRPNESTLCYPVRRGTTTGFLTESEVANAYRSRFQDAFDHASKLQRVFDEGHEGMSEFGWPSDKAWLIVALVPSVPGSMQITHTSKEALGQEIQTSSRNHEFGFGHQWDPYFAADVRFRRVVLSAERAKPPDTGYLQLHSDGSVFGALKVGHRHPNPDTEYYVVDDEVLTASAAFLTDLAGQHAHKRCGSSGQASMRYALASRNADGENIKAALVKSPGRSTMAGIRSRSPIVFSADRACDQEVVLNTLSGTELLLVTRQICTDIGQMLGQPEWLQIGPDGHLQLRHFGAEEHMRHVAQRRGFKISTA